jgi:hypothetical protein
MVLNQILFIMAHKNNKRRLVEDVDSESDTERPKNWARYIILSTLDENEKLVTKLSPFVIEKTLRIFKRLGFLLSAYADFLFNGSFYCQL